jgi:hypothetical protein
LLRVDMQPPNVEPQQLVMDHPHQPVGDQHQPMGQHHQPPIAYPQPSQPTDYQVTSAPQHADAPESSSWLPGANVPHVDASMVSDSWAPGAHAPRVEAGTDSGPAGATAAPWLPGAQMPLAEPHLGPSGDVFHHADGFANGGFANAAAQQADRLVAEAFQPVGSGDAVQASGPFPGAFPGDAATNSVSAVAANDVLAGDEQVTARRVEDLPPDHVVERRYYA